MVIYYIKVVQKKPNRLNFVFLISQVQVIESSKFWCLPPIISPPIMKERHNDFEDLITCTQDIRKTNFYLLGLILNTHYFPTGMPLLG